MQRSIFGRKKQRSSNRRNFGQSSAKYGEMVELGMGEIRKYCIALAEKRGYPEDSFQMIAERVIFLERRGLPGFNALIVDFTNFDTETLAERMSPVRPNGIKGGHCPFFCGVQLNEKLDQFTSGDPHSHAVITAPSSAMLLIPKVANFAGPTGRLVQMIWYRNGQEALRTVLDGYRIAHNGDLTALVDATEVGFARYPEEDYPVPPIRAGEFNNSEIPVSKIMTIQNFLGV